MDGSLRYSHGLAPTAPTAVAIFLQWSCIITQGQRKTTGS